MPSITPGQIRAARAMLDWSMLDLAKAAGVSVSTVKRFDDEQSALVTEGTVGLMQDALEAEGVRFLPDDGNGPGVRLRDLGRSPMTQNEGGRSASRRAAQV